MHVEKLIIDCKRGNRDSQKQLFELYSPRFLSVCKRYMRTQEDAEDVLLQAFFKIYKNIYQYEGTGNFEGWMHRIVVNESLMALRKKTNFVLQLEVNNIQLAEKVTVEDRLAYEEIIQLLDSLPTGYRTVFNLYVVEGYKHREIAELLGISINTSKSQLILAKKRMRDLIKKKHRAHVS